MYLLGLCCCHLYLIDRLLVKKRAKRKDDNDKEEQELQEGIPLKPLRFPSDLRLPPPIVVMEDHIHGPGYCYQYYTLPRLTTVMLDSLHFMEYTRELCFTLVTSITVQRIKDACPKLSWVSQHESRIQPISPFYKEYCCVVSMPEDMASYRESWLADDFFVIVWQSKDPRRIQPLPRPKRA
jgi:hypothetical protein